MADLTQLDRPFLLGKVPAASAARVAQMLRLSNQADYEEAAKVARSLLDGQGYDLQIVVRHLFGAFLEHGFAALPALLDSLAGTLEAAFSAADADEKRLRKDVDLNLTWLCRTLRDRLDYHHAQRDPVYKAWLASAEAKLVEAIRAACARLYAAVERLVPQSRSLELIAGMDAFANETLRGLLSKPAAAPGAAAPGLEPAQATPRRAAAMRRDSHAGARGDEGGPSPPVEEAPERDPDSAARRRAASRALAVRPAPPASGAPPDDCDSPALRLFRDKMAAFAVLMERGDFARAAVVAGDINTVIDHFDPRIYLPRLLSPYFKRLASGVGNLAPYWESSESAAWKAMEQLYLVDLQAFLEED